MKYYKTFLQSELERRCQKNAKYSLRAFAKFLDVDVGLLSKVLTNKRSLSVGTAEQLLRKLGPTTKQRQLFLRSLAEEKVTLPEVLAKSKGVTKSISQTEFGQITNWYHYAILELAYVPTFEVEPRSVAKTFGIGVIEAKFAIERLIKMGLLREIDGRICKTNEQITTTNRKQTTIDLIKYHEQILDLAKTAVKQRKIEERGVFGMTMAIDPKKIPIAKQMIEHFANQVCEMLESGERKEVYQLEVALFPLQKPNQEKP